MAIDATRDLVFLPTTSPSPDFYGGGRVGSDIYANSLVALHAATGKVAWYFQAVHHDLWDYDISAQPTLVTVRRGGTGIAAVAVSIKMGHIFFLNRDTGKPVFPVHEPTGAAGRGARRTALADAAISDGAASADARKTVGKRRFWHHVR
jgi:quinoprotein glucose dehydrogenase